MTSAGWSANVATDSARLSALMGNRPMTKVIMGRTLEEMMAEAKAYVDTLLDGLVSSDHPTTVRDLFLEVLARRMATYPRM
jgi:hypothetical protein